jgi:hypothetical protein
MLSNTREHLARLDNQHDFERLAADVLNHLGEAQVEPVAPSGGSDGGVDLRYLAKDGSSGIGLVTLRKDIGKKFQSDLERISPFNGEISLFCVVGVSPKQKSDFQALAYRVGAKLRIYDLERLRSLLDTSLQATRQTYLGISHDHLNSPRTLASGAETKLILSPSPTNQPNANLIRLYASAPPDQLISVYSVTLFIEEHAQLSTDQLDLLSPDAFVQRFGRKMFASIYRKVVSPALGHPIWHGVELELLGRNTELFLNMHARWSELLIVSELHAPGFRNPIVSRILITRSEDSLSYLYSHEQEF